MLVTHKHLGAAAIAAAIFGAGGGVAINRATSPAAVEHVVQLNVAHKYDWGALTEAEQGAAAKAIGDLDRREVEVFCGVPACQDLAEDIDQVMDLTGAASSVRRPIIELGAGLGISPADDDARRIAAALKNATHGRVVLQVVDQKQPGGGIVIALGQKPRR